MAEAAIAGSKKSTTVRAEPLTLRALRTGLGLLSRVSPAAAARAGVRLFLTPRSHPRPAAEEALLARARPLRLPTAYGELPAWEWGPHPQAGLGPRVLLVHGWEGRGSQLGALAAPLVAKGFRVLTFDAPGHGQSPGGRSSFFHFANSVQAAAAAFGPLHAIVTHSMGGVATLWANRSGALAERFVLIAPPMDLRDFTRFFAGLMRLPDGVRDGMNRRLAAEFGVPIEEVRAERLAPSMRSPALVIHDENDREVPVACGEAIARAWPGAEFLKTSGLGHQRILRDAGVAQTIVRFVAAENPDA